MAMMGQGPQDSHQDAITLRASAAGVWLFIVLAAVFAFALVRGYLGAATTAGRIGTVIFMGLATAGSLWGATFIFRHRSALEISADAITYSKSPNAKSMAQRSRQLVLDRTSGDALSVIKIGNQQRYSQGLTIRGSGTTLPMAAFGVARVKHACTAKGWQFQA